MRRPSLAALAALLLLSLGCLPARRAPFPQPAPAPAGLDARATYLLERCDAALRENAAAAVDPRVDAVTALMQQRLVLVTELETTRAQQSVIEQQLMDARKALRSLAQSDHERLLISEALTDLDEARDIQRALPSRLNKQAELSSLVQTHALLHQNRETRRKVETQLSAIDSTFALLANRSVAPRPSLPASLPPTSLPPTSLPPGGGPQPGPSHPGRPINPGL